MDEQDLLEEPAAPENGGGQGDNQYSDLFDEWQDDLQPPAEDVPPQEEEPPTETAPAVTAPPARPTYTPTVPARYAGYKMSQQEREDFNARYLDDPAGVIEEYGNRIAEQIVEARLREERSVMTTTEYHLQQIAVQNPRLYAEYGPQIRAIVAQAPKDVPQERVAHWAVMSLMSNVVGQTGDIRAVKRFTELMDDDGSAAPAPVPPARPAARPQAQQQPAQRPAPTATRPAAAATRMPSPSAVPAGAGSGRRSASAGGEDTLSLILGSYNMDSDDAQRAAREARRNSRNSGW